MKLIIEVIPQSLWGVNLRNKLGPTAWAAVRKACYVRARHACQICGDINPRRHLDCHEIWQYDDINYVQTLAGFIALCPACHEVKHYGRACAVGRALNAQRHFIRVNGCTPLEMRAHIENSKALWQKRSEFEWSQDLSWFEKNI